MTQPPAPEAVDAPATSPWPALWAVVIGFFMILLDNTIVSVATPAILQDLDTTFSAVIWVTSAYLLAYAVPLLVTGRLGDRYGPRRVYLAGLTLFTLASLWCGLTSSIEGLIVARVFQGFGASMMTPQTMALITRTFPAAKRGAAMALWGATAGVATLLGPIVGGVLTDLAGWEWIFIVNVPIGVIGFVAAWILVPELPTHTHSFDWFGVALSAVGMFCIVFAIQEGSTYDWGTITGIVSVPLLIVVGLVTMAVFFWWQSRIRTEPLVPLRLFRDRNFSLASLGIVAVSFAITSMALPFMFYAQAVRGDSPTEAGLLLVPMALMTAVLAPYVGRLVDRAHPRAITSVGFGASAVAVFWLTRIMEPATPTWQILLAMALFGVGSAFLWAPLAATATRNLPMDSAGAGAGVYNTVRQTAAVLGAAAIAAAIESRLAANLPGFDGSGREMELGVDALPADLAAPFAASMSQSLLLPALALALGLLVAVSFARPSHEGRAPRPVIGTRST
ncbi:drug resistance MFS transporter, drug:H+ antiporter-2 family [Aeromicrobium marinum DSM 15272]|uniref:Drug resistance MFS transporter, drug:H+ antiporter-2 family n=1 Tax=Aeromicrobium marinum DSM 15272 TaxID=585531 RepID=E2SFV5_9ACTN|nr:DHA2 family efflux MFS transporter permease subunit [Aeromicrobium marinum]EFQ81902.1 drug resistance MFS transporter, drug:H+ antiporter-2 family [Aeromicrobium marinum DSM 15272]